MTTAGVTREMASFQQIPVYKLQTKLHRGLQGNLALLFLFSALMVILFDRAKICAVLIEGIKGEHLCEINFVIGPMVQEVLFNLFYFLALVSNLVQ